MDDLKSDSKKCGEVFLTLKGLTIFHCTLCESKYDEIQNFGIHIINKHIDVSNGFEISDSEIDSLLPDIPDILLEQQSLFTEELKESNLCGKEDVPASPTQIDGIGFTNDDSYDKQCGDVNLTKDGILIFFCTLCDNSYKGVKNYNDHVIGEHFSLEGIEEVNFEILWPENYENNKHFETNIRAGVNNDNLSNGEIENKNISFDNKDCSNSVQKNEKLKKPIPKWKQVFETFHCSDTNRDLYKCKLCSTIIKDKSNIHHHINRVHEQTKRFECTECHRLFHAKSELKIHIRHHTGEKPYLCVKCGMTYISASELHRHQSRIHTKRIRDKVCPICGKTFTSQKGLRNHRTVHSEERPFKCKVCDASFKVKSSLRVHNRTHEDKRMFKCTLCSASYNYKSILESHMKTKHALASE